MTGRRFYRVFHDRRRTVQYAVLAHRAGYTVLCWEADLDVPAVVAEFAAASYRGSYAACREAAAEHARAMARGGA